MKSKRLLRGGFLIGQLDEAANLNQNALHGAAPEVRRGHVDADARGDVGDRTGIVVERAEWFGREWRKYVDDAGNSAVT